MWFRGIGAGGIAAGRWAVTDRVDYQTGNGVAVLSLATGPKGRGGVLDAPARRALMAALDRAEADPAVRALVLTGQDRGFPDDLAMNEIAAGEAAPSLDDLCLRIETLSKPVVAALRGQVGDGGLALALAARARLAAAGTRLVFEAIRRGLIPGGGATQRLPRLIGAETAIEMIFAGRKLPVEAHRLSGLFHAIVARNVVGAAADLARDLAVAGPARREALPPGLSDPIGYQEILEARREANAALPPEAEAALDCIEAAQLLPLEAGLAMEDSLRAELRATARARGLMRSQAVGARGPSVALAPTRLTILGDGPAALALAVRALGAGMAVALAEQRDGGADLARRRIAAHLGEEVTRGRLSAVAREAHLERLTGGSSEVELARAEVVIEMTGAPLAAMQPLRAALAQAGDPLLLLSSNMALRAGELAGVLGPRAFGLCLSERPGVAGRGLAEIATGAAPDDDGVTRARALLRRLGYGALACPATNGLIAGRLKAALLAAAEWCVAQGATPQRVDAALGWPLGPFHQADAEGLEVQRDRFEALDWVARHGGLIRHLLQAGRRGRAAGRGVFSYAAQGAAGDYDAEARALVEAWRGGKETAAPGAVAIRRRVWSALFNAGLHLLDEGTARDAGDIDLAGLEALGLPGASGGPMKTGEIRGLLAVRHELDAWSKDDPGLWPGSERLIEMIKNGEGFGY